MTFNSDPFHPFHKTEWGRSDDYDPEGADWIQVSTIGSDFEQQMDRNREDHFRHRHILSRGPWTHGPAPKE